ncbi:MAG: transposase [Bacteroidales bacterium]|nr:transposase [Bacteroidales bacterium]
MEKALIGYFLPAGLLEHFKITNIEELGEVSYRRIAASNWSEIQEQRAKLLFKHYPLLNTAYKHILEFRSIYELHSRSDAENRLLKWIDRTEKLQLKEFNTVAYTIKYNHEQIL